MKQLILFIFIGCSIAGTAQNTAVRFDTLNCTDSNGKKQGYWIILGTSKPKGCFMFNQKVEEGYYKNNRKTGVWTEYYCNGYVRSILTFENGRPSGFAQTYHDNGRIKEVGYWLNNRWAGPHKEYTREGKNIATPFPKVYGDTTSKSK